MGAGFGITQRATFRIATENTIFAMPEAKLGFYTDAGSSFTLSRMRNHIGYYLGMTGLRLNGEEVFIAGVANFFIPRADLVSVEKEVIEALPSAIDPT